VTDFGPQPTLRPYATIQIPGIYGNHVPYDRGDSVKTPDIQPGTDKHADSWNARIVGPTGDYLALWVHEIEVSFELGGNVAQSRRMRQFFPHSFSQVTMTVRGVTPNNYEYNRLASFVRMSQYWALYGDDFARVQRALGDNVSNRHYPDGTSIPTSQFILRGNHNTQVTPGRTIKGANAPWNVEGYIKSIQAGASRFEYAKEYEFNFTVAYTLANGAVGIFEDSAARGQKILSWMDVFKKTQFQGVGPTQPASNEIDLIDGLVSFVEGLF
jgi:hypothetical protein